MARQHRDGWQADVIHEGKRLRRQFASQQEAEQWEASFKVSPALSKPTLFDYVKPRVDLIWERGSKHGEKQYYQIKNLHKFIDCPLEDITQAKINDLIAALQKQGDSGGTINRKLAAVSKALKYAKHDGVYQREIPRFTRQREARGRIRFLEWDEEQRLSNELSKYNPRYPDFVAFMCDTGVRCSNGTGLLWRDVKLPVGNGRGTITLWETKQGEPQTVPLTTRAVEALKRQRQYDKDAPGPFKWLNPWTLRKHIKEAAIDAGLGNEVVIHTFRHTCASRLVMKGVDIRRVQKFMGHKTITMTLRYAHLAPKELESCVDALDMMGV